MLAWQVNDAVLTGGNTLVSCSSDATVKVCGPIYAEMYLSLLVNRFHFEFNNNVRYGMACLMEHVSGRFINTQTM